MTVASELSSVTRLWTGVETVFSTGMPAIDAAHVSVSYMNASGVVVPLIRGVHYTSRLVPASARTAAPLEVLPLSMPTPPLNLLISRVTPATQPLDLSTGYFDPEALERQLDGDALRDTERRNDLDRAVKVRPGQLPPELDMAQFVGQGGGVVSIDNGGQILRIPGGAPGASIVTTQITDSGSVGRDILRQSTVAQVFAILGIASAAIIPEAMTGTFNDTDRMLAAFALAQSSGRQIQGTPDRVYDLAGWPAAGVLGTAPLTFVGNGCHLKPPAYDALLFKPNGSVSFDNTDFDAGWRGLLWRLNADGGTLLDARFTRNRVVGLVGMGIHLECPVTGIDVLDNKFSGVTNRNGDFRASAISIGQNDDTKQDGWRDLNIAGNMIRNVSSTGASTAYPIILYGQDAKINNNRVTNTRSVDAGCIPIYTKLRWCELSGNRVVDYTSTGSANDAADVVGISVKGDIFPSTTISPEGRASTVTNNVTRLGGLQGVKGTGIRSQSALCIISANVINDMGRMYIDINDFGSYGTICTGNQCDSFYFSLPNVGIGVASRSPGTRVQGNMINGALTGIQLDGLGAPNAGALSDLDISGNTVNSGRAGSIGIRFASGTITNVDVHHNHINVTGSVFSNDSAARERLQIRDNPLARSAAAGATLWAGSLPTDTYMANNEGWNHHTQQVINVPSGAGTIINHLIADIGLATSAAVPGDFSLQAVGTLCSSHVNSTTSTQTRVTHGAGAAVDFYFKASSFMSQRIA